MIDMDSWSSICSFLNVHLISSIKNTLLLNYSLIIFISTRITIFVCSWFKQLVTIFYSFLPNITTSIIHSFPSLLQLRWIIIRITFISFLCWWLVLQLWFFMNATHFYGPKLSIGINIFSWIEDETFQIWLRSWLLSWLGYEVFFVVNVDGNNILANGTGNWFIDIK